MTLVIAESESQLTEKAEDSLGGWTSGNHVLVCILRGTSLREPVEKKELKPKQATVCVADD